MPRMDPPLTIDAEMGSRTSVRWASYCLSFRRLTEAILLVMTGGRGPWNIIIGRGVGNESKMPGWWRLTSAFDSGTGADGPDGRRSPCKKRCKNWKRVSRGGCCCCFCCFTCGGRKLMLGETWMGLGTGIGTAGRDSTIWDLCNAFVRTLRLTLFQNITFIKI